jgi:NAD(P)-dependent dehydrogenase (short-subunit alcohol dehydrogenase family)
MELSSGKEIETCVSELNADRVDVLINNAGRFDGGLLENQELDQIYSMTQVNFAGLIHLTKALMAPMLARGHGKIVNNASIAGYPLSGRRRLLGHQGRSGRLHGGAATRAAGNRRFGAGGRHAGRGDRHARRGT